MNPFLAVCVMLALLVGGMLLVEWAATRGAWHPELSRKTIHVLMGLACVGFPWIFDSPGPVWILAFLSTVTLSAFRVVPALKDRFGRVLGGVERRSFGDLIFAPAIAFVFWLADGDPLKYCVPVLALALADAAGALVGRRYGFAKFDTDDGAKSVEGSLAVFVTAFFTAHAAILLFTNTGRLESLLISLVIGFLLMLIEAIAWRGLDNAAIPLVAYVCLARLLPLSARELTVRLVVLLILLGSFCALQTFTRFTPSAMVGASLILYVNWAVGRWPWVVAPLSVLVGYLLLRATASRTRTYNIFIIAWIGLTGLFWLCLSGAVSGALYPCVVGYGAHLAMISLAYLAHASRKASVVAAVVKSAAIGFLLPAIPQYWIWRSYDRFWELTCWAAVLIATSAALFAIIQPSLRNCPDNASRWTREGTIAFGVSMIAFGIQTVL